MKIENIKNQNDLAVFVTEQEGLKKAMTIGQVKELLKIMGNTMLEQPVVIELLLAGARKRAKK